MPFNRDQSTAVRRKGRTVPAAPEARVARASSAANLQVNALLGNFQGQVDNIMRSLTDQLEQEDAEDAGAEPVVGPTEYALATSTGYMDEQEHEAAAYQPPSPVRRLLLIDKQVSPHGHLANAALDCVTVVKYDSDDTTLEDLLELIRFAHRKQGFPFTSIACAQHGPNEEGLWIWTSDLVVDLGGGSPLSPITQLTPIVEALGMALEKTRMGKAHIDFLACGLAGFAPRLVLGLEKLYGIDFRASTDDTGNDVNGGDWKMETDNDYDVANDYLDRVKLVAYTEKMNGKKSAKEGMKNLGKLMDLKLKKEMASSYKYLSFMSFADMAKGAALLKSTTDKCKYVGMWVMEHLANVAVAGSNGIVILDPEQQKAVACQVGGMGTTDEWKNMDLSIQGIFKQIPGFNKPPKDTNSQKKTVRDFVLEQHVGKPCGQGYSQDCCKWVKHIAKANRKTWGSEAGPGAKQRMKAQEAKFKDNIAVWLRAPNTRAASTPNEAWYYLAWSAQPIQGDCDEEMWIEYVRDFYDEIFPQVGFKKLTLEKARGMDLKKLAAACLIH